MRALWTIARRRRTSRRRTPGRSLTTIPVTLIAAAALQDARFGFVDGEAFVLGDVADSGEQVAGFIGVVGALGGLRGLRGGEGQVVGVAGKLPAEFGGDAGQARIEATGDEIRDRRARARALWERTWTCGDIKSTARVFDFAARRFCAEQSEDCGDGRRITELFECPADPVERNRWKEIFQVGVHEHVFADVRGCVGANRASFNKTVCS